MPYATTDDGVNLYYEETGAGAPIVFVHEFAGDCRSWESQVRYFARRYRCVTYNARGFPPSDTPDDLERYTQDRARDDIAAVLDHLRVERAHVVGLSMGSFATLHFGLRYPDRALSLVVAGCGYGSAPDRREQFQQESEQTARMIEREGSAAFAEHYAVSAARVQFQNKDPRGWAEFRDRLAARPEKGAALTMRGVQKRRPSLWDLWDQMRQLRVPTLIVTGDEDEPSLEPALFMKRTIPASGLVVIPKSGHTVNLEEPDIFNRCVQDFLTTVDAGRWEPRDPRSVTSGVLGI